MRLLRLEAMTNLRPSKGPLEEQSVRAMDGAADLHGCVVPLRSGWPFLAFAPNSQLFPLNKRLSHPSHTSTINNTAFQNIHLSLFAILNQCHNTTGGEH